MTKEELQKQIKELRESINLGVLTVTSPNGRTVTYRSLREMRSILNSLNRELMIFDEDYEPRRSIGTPVGFRGEYD